MKSYVHQTNGHKFRAEDVTRRHTRTNPFSKTKRLGATGDILLRQFSLRGSPTTLLLYSSTSRSHVVLRTESSLTKAGKSATERDTRGTEVTGGGNVLQDCDSLPNDGVPTPGVEIPTPPTTLVLSLYLVVSLVTLTMTRGLRRKE